MFEGATAFNQSLKSWDVSDVINMEAMFRGATSFSAEYREEILTNWDMEDVVKKQEMFDEDML
jgi:hypothetical protein